MRYRTGDSSTHLLRDIFVRHDSVEELYMPFIVFETGRELNSQITVWNVGIVEGNESCRKLATSSFRLD